MEGVKYDGEKPTTDLLPFDALLGVADVLRYGKAKYAARNWEKGMAWGRLLGAGLRHSFAWASGQDKDPESGLHHLAHACCCFLMLYALVLRKVGVDDRTDATSKQTTEQAQTPDAVAKYIADKYVVDANPVAAVHPARVKCIKCQKEYFAEQLNNDGWCRDCFVEPTVGVPGVPNLPSKLRHSRKKRT